MFLLGLLVLTFFPASIVALGFLLLSKKKRISIAVCIVIFLTPVFAVITIGAMYLRPYVEYGDTVSALKTCDSRIEDVELYMQPNARTALTANERHTGIYDNEELEIKIFLGSEDADAEAAAEIGNAAKDVVDAYIREHFNEGTGLEKRVNMVLYPVSMQGLDDWDVSVVGSRRYYRIWDFENERFEWLLDGNLWEYYPEGHPSANPYWVYRASMLYQSYFHVDMSQIKSMTPGLP
ncbi:MAG: hypothetical protein LBK57_10960 [Clostridiales Family XIII bacterium]|jgi:hypothetical protein|nr:hypothetical protein [Clostridiales Family XIII bacterium]